MEEVAHDAHVYAWKWHTKGPTYQATFVILATDKNERYANKRRQRIEELKAAGFYQSGR